MYLEGEKIVDVFIFGIAVMSLITYFFQLTIDPNIPLMETLLVSIFGGIVLQDFHMLAKKILRKEKETGV